MQQQSSQQDHVQQQGHEQQPAEASAKKPGIYQTHRFSQSLVDVGALARRAAVVQMVREGEEEEEERRKLGRRVSRRAGDAGPGPGPDGDTAAGGGGGVVPPWSPTLAEIAVELAKERARESALGIRPGVEEEEAWKATDGVEEARGDARPGARGRGEAYSEVLVSGTTAGSEAEKPGDVKYLSPAGALGQRTAATVSAGEVTEQVGYGGLSVGSAVLASRGGASANAGLGSGLVRAGDGVGAGNTASFPLTTTTTASATATATLAVPASTTTTPATMGNVPSASLVQGVTLDLTGAIANKRTSMAPPYDALSYPLRKRRSMPTFTAPDAAPPPYPALEMEGLAAYNTSQWSARANTSHADDEHDGDNDSEMEHDHDDDTDALARATAHAPPAGAGASTHPYAHLAARPYATSAFAFPGGGAPPTIAPREDEGREALPPYSNAVHMRAEMLRKREFDAPGVQARDRKWRRVVCELDGTVLRVYRPARARERGPVGHLGAWWERAVGAGTAWALRPARRRRRRLGWVGAGWCGWMRRAGRRRRGRAAGRLWRARVGRRGRRSGRARWSWIWSARRRGRGRAAKVEKRARRCLHCAVLVPARWHTRIRQRTDTRRARRMRTSARRTIPCQRVRPAQGRSNAPRSRSPCSCSSQHRARPRRAHPRARDPATRARRASCPSAAPAQRAARARR
ncbi:hypothetical protein BJ912DRAFT_324628 [Pholiota molesta]|nr:hypothetical protein BJ912DRAFT_324628 [Pholiota molesta]